MTYTLDIKRKKIGAGRSILFVFAGLFAMALLMIIAWLVKPYFHYGAYLPYVAGFALVAFVYYRYVLEYRVILRDGHIYVCRISGDREKPLWDAPARDIVYFGPVEGAPPVEKHRRFVIAQNSFPVRVAVTKHAGAACFQADAELERLLNEARNAPPKEETDKREEKSTG